MKLLSLSFLVGMVGLWGFPSSCFAEETDSSESDLLDLPWSTFRALQTAHVRDGSTAWRKGSGLRIQSEFWADEALNALEQEILNILLEDSFSFTIRSRHREDAPARTLHLEASLSQEARDLLEPQRPGESRVAFLYRREAAGLEAFVALISNDEEAFLEGSQLFAEEILFTFQKAQKENYRGGIALEKHFQVHRSRLEKWDREKAQIYRNFIRVAAARAFHMDPTLSLMPAEDFFDNPEDLYTEARMIIQSLEGKY